LAGIVVDNCNFNFLSNTACGLAAGVGNGVGWRPTVALGVVGVVAKGGAGSWPAIVGHGGQVLGRATTGGAFPSVGAGWRSANRPLLPVFMGRGLQLVVMQLMLLLLLLLLLLMLLLLMQHVLGQECA
jgi:hypothetical protein